jgi:TonB family protein
MRRPFANRRVRGITLTLFVVLGGDLIAQTWTPAALRSGQFPPESPLSVGIGGGQVLLELIVSREGRVGEIKTLRTTGPFADRVATAAQAWSFAPAEEAVDPALRRPGDPARRAVASKVLIAGVFLPPALHTPTFGEPVKDIAPPSDDVPMPLSIVTPPLSPVVSAPGVVIVEVRVTPDGVVGEAKVTQSAAGYDDAALNAARQWRFQPARVRNRPSTSFAYIIFSFPPPRI